MGWGCDGGAMEVGWGVRLEEDAEKGTHRCRKDGGTLM